MPTCLNYDTEKKQCTVCKNKKVKSNCGKLYHHYKGICNGVKKCRYTLTRTSKFEDFVLLFEELIYFQNIAYKCFSLRNQHKKECMSKECADTGHQQQIEDIQNSADKCLTLIYKLTKDALSVANEITNTTEKKKWNDFIQHITKFVKTL